jgi:hypothetical protein
MVKQAQRKYFTNYSGKACFDRLPNQGREVLVFPLLISSGIRYSNSHFHLKAAEVSSILICFLTHLETWGLRSNYRIVMRCISVKLIIWICCSRIIFYQTIVVVLKSSCCFLLKTISLL